VLESEQEKSEKKSPVNGVLQGINLFKIW